MRILIDTNIVIPLEDSSKVLDESLAKLAKLASENNHQLIAHPSSFDDINRDADGTRRKISLSKIRKYPVLENPPIPNGIELATLGLIQVDDNDRVDNQILYGIYKDAANILVTEDRDIHKKAESLGIGDRVHYVQEAIEFLERLHAKVPVSLPNIEELPLYQIDLNSEFFDSLREDYSTFNEWYKKVSPEGRRAWIYKSDSGELGAIAIYKEENDPIITEDNKALPGKALKLCTFKVGVELQGRKIGELFLKAAFRYATYNRMEHIYVTMRPGKHELLKDLCLDFGFYYFGRSQVDHGIDDVYVKDQPINPPSSEFPSLEYHIKYYPHFKSDPNQGKYIVPIIPTFHGILFPDHQRQLQRQPTQLSLFSDYYATVGNAIKQAYLCHARIHGIVPGDILLFYRSHDLKAITSVGVVESVHEFKDPDKIMELVSKRTVYSYNDVVDMAKKVTKVILFRLAMHMPQPVPYDWLLEKGVVNGRIQSIRKVPDESFRRILSEWEVHYCFHAD